MGNVSTTPADKHQTPPPPNSVGGGVVPLWKSKQNSYGIGPVDITKANVSDVKDLEDEGDKNRTRFPVAFKYLPPSTNLKVNDVFVCGSFNDWKPIRLVKSVKDFITILDVEEGDHEYKYIVDGKWTLDYKSPVTENQALTSQRPPVKSSKDLTKHKYNKITVHKHDFDADKALDNDEEYTASIAAAKSNHPPISTLEYGTYIPSVEQYNRLSVRHANPPSLPPHLLNVILNSDVPLSSEPVLLPEPNRVMINHMYALAIREKVMVLSSIQRYRKKCITTLFYTPMP